MKNISECIFDIIDKVWLELLLGFLSQNDLYFCILLWEIMNSFCMHKNRHIIV